MMLMINIYFYNYTINLKFFYIIIIWKIFKNIFFLSSNLLNIFSILFLIIFSLVIVFIVLFPIDKLILFNSYLIFISTYYL